jgi:hypothetical protein
VSEFICLIEADRVDSNFLASSNHRGNGSIEYATSSRGRLHAAIALANAIGARRNMTLVALTDAGDGSYRARFSDAPEQEGA